MTKYRGFKAMNPDMTCRDFQFELGKTFYHGGDVIPCKSGFHFCQKIKNVFAYYNHDCRIFEVEAINKGKHLITVVKNDKTICNNIKIIKEIDYSKYIDHDSIWIRMCVANKGIGLDILVNDQSWEVRLEVAKQGYGLDKLINYTYIQYTISNLLKLTKSQQRILSNKKEEPIFMYINEKGKACFGLTRTGKISVDITNSLRPLYTRGVIGESEISFDFYKNKSTTPIKANIIKLNDKMKGN